MRSVQNILVENCAVAFFVAKKAMLLRSRTNTEEKMIVWSGFGFLVLVLGVASLLLTELACKRILGDYEPYLYERHGWLFLVGMSIAAILTYGLHRLLLLQKGRVVIDRETGQELILRPGHSFFFIPVKWWPILFLLIGVGVTLGETFW